MSKLLFTLGLFFASLFLSLGVYANTDYPIASLSDYKCDPTTGIGTLRLVFGSTYHHLDTRYYTLNHKGWYRLYNSNRNYSFADIPWTAIPGCERACTTGPIYAITSHDPVDWRHDVMPWPAAPGVDGPPPAPYSFSLGNASHADAYVHSGHWPAWTQARSGDFDAAIDLGDYEWKGDTAVGFARTQIQFSPSIGGGLPNLPACYPASCGSANSTELKSTPLTAGSAGLCAQGSSSVFTESIDDAGVTHYSWICQQTGGNPTSCTNAQYKPVCVPSSSDGCCSETRANPNANGDTKLMTELPQCMYNVLYNQTDIGMIYHAMPTQTGPSVVNISQVAGATCRPPVDGKPRVSCGANPLISISSTLSSFTLPSTVTQLPGTCTVTFDAPDVCRVPTPTTLTITPAVCDEKIKDPKDPKYCGPDECDPTIDDYTHPSYCPRKTTKEVCVELKDGFGNPVKNYATGSIVSVLGPVKTNPYFEKYNTGKDTTIYQEGSYVEVDGKYCAPICVKGDPRPECNPKCDLAITDPNNSKFCPCKIGDTRAICISDPPGTCDPAITDPKDNRFCKCTTGDTRAICISTDVCDSAITDSADSEFCKCTTGDTRVACNVCIPTELNNYCNPPKCVDNPTTTVNECSSCVDNPTTTVNECIPTPTTVPGCGEVGYTGDPLECVPVNKACTAYIEVKSDNTWIDSGDGILYDEPMQYRIRMRDADPICRTGIISIQEITATGGVLSGAVSYQADGSFFATIKRSSASTPITARGPLIRALFTQPGGITYGLTDRADDFQDTPLSITGERMKGVRIIGNSAGTTVTNFNLNNGGVIGEETGASVVAARNAMIKSAALLTRGVTPADRVINGVYYVEGDILYSTVRATGFKTLIVKGNLTIDENIGDINGSDTGVGIIVIRDSIGSKGNVVVTDTVTYIHALIFSEETFRGISQTAGVLNPKTQLVLKGTLFSRNTVGGYAELGKYYTSGGSPTTDANLAFRQDLNNVRNGYGCQAGVTCTLYKGYKDPFIIDFDNMQSSPPPGFSN